MDSEIEIAASSDGKHIVVANNLRDFITSHDGGLTFQPTKSIDPGFTANGDPSLAYGKSGNFYYAFIGYPSSEQCTTALAKLEDNGGSFDFQAAAVVCDDTSNKCFPDQEHIAADRFQAASGGDWIYSVWRNFVGGDCTDIMGPVEPSIVCSSDSGATWTTPKIFGTGDFPRVTVSQDGSVYVVYLSGDQIMLNKFSSCDAGLEQQTEFPRPIAEHRPVDCDQGVPGLDRCNGRNTLASPMLAVDDTDPFHLYLAYASKTADGTNENILVQDSTDGGLNWRTPEVANKRRGCPPLHALDLYDQRGGLHLLVRPPVGHHGRQQPDRILRQERLSGRPEGAVSGPGVQDLRGGRFQLRTTSPPSIPPGR